MPTLTESLHPRRFAGMSGKMVAIVGYILGEKWSKPNIAEMVVTSDATPSSVRRRTWSETGTTSCERRV